MTDVEKCRLESFDPVISRGPDTIKVGEKRTYCVSADIECGGMCDGVPCKEEVQYRWYYKSRGGQVMIEHPGGHEYSSRNMCVKVEGIEEGGVTLEACVSVHCRHSNPLIRNEECTSFELKRVEKEITITA